MSVKKNHYAEFLDNPNKLSESMRLQTAHNDFLDYNTSKKTTVGPIQKRQKKIKTTTTLIDINRIN